MHPRRAYKLSVVVFVLACVSAATALVLYQLRANINYFYTPTEVSTAAPLNKDLRLGGYVKQDSITYLDDGRVHFVLTDGNAEISVVYANLLPALFAEGEAAVVNGRMQTATLLVARQVLAKHDENYRPPELDELARQRAERARLLAP